MDTERVDRRRRQEVRYQPRGRARRSFLGDTRTRAGIHTCAGRTSRGAAAVPAKTSALNPFVFFFLLFSCTLAATPATQNATTLSPMLKVSRGQVSLGVHLTGKLKHSKMDHVKVLEGSLFGTKEEASLYFMI